ncbi:hypothetical protein [Peribacillus simplex]|uniref:hypothetical protein n=1 Tax=Peribacillus simplex TaxID=1478 RepID=UPI003D9C38C8
MGKINKRGIPMNAVLLTLFLGQVSLITNSDPPCATSHFLKEPKPPVNDFKICICFKEFD